MTIIYIYFTIIGALINAAVVFFLFFKLQSLQKKSYLNDCFKKFFFLFGIYFLLISLVLNAFTQKPYFYFFLVEITHFVLIVSLAFLFSAFLYLKDKKTTQTAFWLFITGGFLETIYAVYNINPEISSISDSAIYFDNSWVLIFKSAILGIGFLYPAFSFLKEALTVDDKIVARRSLLLSLSFTLWLTGGFLHSQFLKSYIFILGDILLLSGSLIAGSIIIKKQK